MASKDKKGPDGQVGGPVVRRAAGADDEPRGIRDLPSDFQALAEDEKPPRRPRKNPGIEDPRAHGLISGVSNFDARLVYDTRVQALRANQDNPEALALGLAEVVLLKLWRARAVTGFDAFAQDVVGMDPARARELAKQGAVSLGIDELAPLQQRPQALWLRTEVTLIKLCPTARVTIGQRNGVRELRMVLPLDEPLRTLEGLAEVGRQADGLRRLLRG